MNELLWQEYSLNAAGQGSDDPMDETLRKLLEETPERSPRSKLEPHTEVIRELRKKRRTYQEIAAFFREHLQLAVAPSRLPKFENPARQYGVTLGQAAESNPKPNISPPSTASGCQNTPT